MIPQEAQDVIGLTRDFLDGGVAATVYDDTVRDAFSRMPRLGRPLFFILEDLAVACASFVPEPEFRDALDIDEDQLRAAARHALARIEAECPPER